MEWEIGDNVIIKEHNCKDTKHTAGMRGVITDVNTKDFFDTVFYIVLDNKEMYEYVEGEFLFTYTGNRE